MEAQATAIAQAATEFVGRWNRLVSSTNWEKGRIISEWRRSLMEADAPADAYTDEAWSRQVGGVTPQHVGRLRRVFERFGDVHDQYPGLYWSHFQAALDWPDAEMYLEGAVQNGWSVAAMREQRWEALGEDPAARPLDSDPAAPEWDEDFTPERDLPPPTLAESLGEVHPAGDGWDAEPSTVSEPPSPRDDQPSAPRLRPFEALPPLPDDLQDAFERMKLAILAHKVGGWSAIARDDVLAMLDALTQLALAPAE